MALPILDGNQSATTLSTILTSGQHIPAHTIVSLGTQAITDMRSAVSGSVVSISNLATTQPISGTVTIGNSVTAANIAMLNASVATDGVADSTLNFFKIGGHQSGANQTSHIVHVSAGGSMSVDASDSVVSISNFPSSQVISGTVTANPTGTQTIAGTVTANGLAVGSTVANVFPIGVDTLYSGVRTVTDLTGYRLPISLGDSNAVVSASLSDPIPAGTNRIGVVTIGGGTVTIGAGTAQIGSVTASISGTVPVSISSVTIGNSVTIGSLPAISGTVTVGAVSTTVTIANHQGTSVTTSNFTSTTASTTLASANASREVLTIFNEGAGNLHICAGATCTTIAYQVRLSAGDYYEVPLNQTSLTHSAVFATAGTARVTQIS